jgi:hypothetical protein
MWSWLSFFTSVSTFSHRQTKKLIYTSGAPFAEKRRYKPWLSVNISVVIISEINFEKFGFYYYHCNCFAHSGLGR